MLPSPPHKTVLLSGEHYVKAVRAVGRGEAHSPHGAKTKKDT